MEKKKKLPKLPYDVSQVLGIFNLVRKQGSQKLTLWLQNPEPIREEWAGIIEKRRINLKEDGNVWNEEKLKMQFLSSLFIYADFNKKNTYSIFYETPLSGELNGYAISLVCDSLVAKPFGIDTPSTP